VEQLLKMLSPQALSLLGVTSAQVHEELRRLEEEEARVAVERRLENDQTGFKLATSCGGVSTGERGDRILLDDPHNVIKAESQLEREKTVRFVRESMSNRLNDERSAIVVIMQRLHDNDVSGDILAREANYCHMLVPMYFDPLRYPASADGTATEDPESGEEFSGNDIGWIDPRALDADGRVLSPQGLAAREGMLAWPKRFPRARVKEYEYELGPYAFAGQYQQSPQPRSGGIFKREYWQPYVVPTEGPRKGKWPDFDFVVVSLDSAFTEKEENDPTGCTTWGVWTDPKDGYPKVILIILEEAPADSRRGAAAPGPGSTILHRAAVNRFRRDRGA
jgi:hypothetical protein